MRLDLLNGKNIFLFSALHIGGTCFEKIIVSPRKIIVFLFPFLPCICPGKVKLDRLLERREQEGTWASFES